MKINWFSTYPVYQVYKIFKRTRKVEPIENIQETNNDKKQDTYEIKGKSNEE